MQTTTSEFDAGHRFLPGFGVGERPEAPLYTGIGRSFDVGIHTFDWTEESIEENESASVDEAAALRGRGSTP